MLKNWLTYVRIGRNIALHVGASSCSGFVRAATSTFSKADFSCSKSSGLTVPWSSTRTLRCTETRLARLSLDFGCRVLLRDFGSIAMGG